MAITINGVSLDDYGGGWNWSDSSVTGYVADQTTLDNLVAAIEAAKGSALPVTFVSCGEAIAGATSGVAIADATRTTVSTGDYVIQGNTETLHHGPPPFGSGYHVRVTNRLVVHYPVSGLGVDSSANCSIEVQGTNQGVIPTSGFFIFCTDFEDDPTAVDHVTDPNHVTGYGTINGIDGKFQTIPTPDGATYDGAFGGSGGGFPYQGGAATVIIPGATYEFSIQVSKNQRTSDSIPLLLNAEFRNSVSSGAVVGSTVIANETFTGNTWRSYSVQAVAPAGVDRASFGFNPVTGNWLIDNACIRGPL